MSFTQRHISLSGSHRLPLFELGPSDGTPVLFLHGLSDDAHSYVPLVKALPDTCRGVALTQRGHGDADRPADGYEPSQLAADAIDAIDALGINRFIVVGHSMGGHVAMRLASEYPERVLGLVLIGAFDTLSHYPELAAEVDALVESIGDELDEAWVREFQAGTLAGPVDPGFFEAVVRASLKVPPRVWRAAWAGMRDSDVRVWLNNVVCPSLLLWGDRDAFVPREMQKRLLDNLGDAQFVVREGVGHGVHWEEPSAVARLIADFAAVCTAPSAAVS